MNAMLRAFEHVAWSIAVLCLAWVGFTLIEQAHYTSAARALATSARATAAMTRLTPALFGQPGELGQSRCAEGRCEVGDREVWPSRPVAPGSDQPCGQSGCVRRGDRAGPRVQAG